MQRTARFDGQQLWVAGTRANECHVSRLLIPVQMRLQKCVQRLRQRALSGVVERLGAFVEVILRPESPASCPKGQNLDRAAKWVDPQLRRAPK